MRGRLYSSDGPLMSEGTCDVADDAITMVTDQWHMTPQLDGPPLTLTLENGRGAQVTVADIQVRTSDAGSGPTEVYRLVPVQSG